MTDFKITFQAAKLLYGDYEKMSLISEMICSEKKQIKQHYIVKEMYQPLWI